MPKPEGRPGVCGGVAQRPPAEAQRQDQEGEGVNDDEEGGDFSILLFLAVMLAAGNAAIWFVTHLVQ